MRARKAVFGLLLCGLAFGQAVNPGRVNVVTTPWSVNWLTHANDATALTDLGVSAWMQTWLGSADAPTLAAAIEQDRYYDVRWSGAVGDGSDQAVAINAALTAGAGGVVMFPEGTWGYGSVVQIPADTIVMGVGSGTILKPTANTSIRFTGSTHAALTNLAWTADLAVSSAVQIRDDACDVTIDGVTFDSAHLVSQLVHIYDANEIQIRNCDFERGSRDVIQEATYTSNDVVIENCTFRDSISIGITCNCGTTAPSRNWQILNCRFLDHHDYPTAGATDAAISFTRITGAVVSGNVFRRVAGQGVIHAENLDGQYIVTNNLFLDCVGGHAYVDLLNNEKHVLVANNVFSHPNTTLTATGICSNADYYSNDMQITGNRFVGNASRTFTGISLAYSHLGRKIIGDNLFRDCDYAVAVNKTDNLVLSANQMFDSNYGFYAGGGKCDDITMIGNRIYASTLALDVPHNATYPYARRWIVQGNVLSGGASAYNAWDWLVLGNQVPTGTLSLDNGDVQRLTADYNSDRPAVDLDQGGRTLAIGTVNIGIAAYTPDLWYKLDDNAANKTVADSGGGGADLTAWVNTDAMTTAGVVNTALDFNGVADRAYRNTAAATGTSGSVTAWVHPSAWGAGIYVVSSADEASTTHYAGLYCDADGRLTWNQRNADTADRAVGNTRMTLDEWHHVAAVSTGTAYALYVDGERQTITMSSGADTGDWWDDATAKDNLVVGAFVTTSSSGFWSGSLDDVRIYSEVLTAAEVAYMATARSETFGGAITYNGQSVSLGANDSGGAGYRLLRVPNP